MQKKRAEDAKKRKEEYWTFRARRSQYFIFNTTINNFSQNASKLLATKASAEKEKAKMKPKQNPKESEAELARPASSLGIKDIRGVAVGASTGSAASPTSRLPTSPKKVGPLKTASKSPPEFQYTDASPLGRSKQEPVQAYSSPKRKPLRTRNQKKFLQKTASVGQKMDLQSLVRVGRNEPSPIAGTQGIKKLDMSAALEDSVKVHNQSKAINESLNAGKLSTIASSNPMASSPLGASHILLYRVTNTLRQYD